MDLRVSRSLDLLGNLQTTVADFARQEDTFTKDIRSRRYASDRKYQEAKEQATAMHGSRSEEIQKRLNAQETAIRSQHEARKDRIERMENYALRNLPRLARERRERWLGQLQAQKMAAERDFKAQLRYKAGDDPELLAAFKDQRKKIDDLDERAALAFNGYGSFKKLLRRRAKNIAPAEDDVDIDPWVDEIDEHLTIAGQNLEELEAMPLPKFFSNLPMAAMVLIVLIIGAAVAYTLGFDTPNLIKSAIITGGLFLLSLMAWATGLSQGSKPARDAALALAQSDFLHKTAMATIDSRRERAKRDLQEHMDTTNAQIGQQWDRAGDIEKNFEVSTRERLRVQVPRCHARNDRLMAQKLGRISAQRDSLLSQIQGDQHSRGNRFDEVHADEIAELAAEEKQGWEQLRAGWQKEVLPRYNALKELQTSEPALFPDWSADLVGKWDAPRQFSSATRFGHLTVDLTQNPDGIPKDPRLALPGTAEIDVPLALAFPNQGSLLIETTDANTAVVADTINNVILRLLATTPPGKMAFTIIDPVGLGQNFAGLMHLADYEESLINRRIWTQRDQIEERLAELNEHIEKVIQMYLRNEYATITEYNEQAGSVAEKYHFLVIADFPANFSDTAAKRLQSIAVSGPRCGVYTLIHWDHRQPLPDGFVADELRQSSVCIRQEKGKFIIDAEPTRRGAVLSFDAPPSAELSVELVHKIGKASIDSNRVEVPFSQVSPKPDELWTLDTTSELKIAVGRTGATKLQYLAIGKGTRQHALFAGKTGSGKSTLFHVIITNLALAADPDHVEFYLIDFKKGVEFKCYATHKLPHAKVIAIESDREFGLSVLQRIDEELKRRGDMFRKLGVQDVAGYKKAGGTEPIPRTLLIIDEFQEFFVEDDSIAQNASVLFDRIVRQGRAFGIHVLLGSQTLGGAYTLARTTLGQMVIRVALQCNEADAYLIMDENNPAPRLLTRPGEGIYNDAAGAVEGNSPFQVVWLSDDERDAALDRVQQLAEQRHLKPAHPIVFEGNAPSDVTENGDLLQALITKPTKAPTAARCWLGAPNSIKGPTNAAFHRQSGNHLLIVGQREEAALAMLGTSIISLAAQYPAGTARFILIHGTTPGSQDAAFIDHLTAIIPHGLTVSRGQDIAEIMEDISTQLKDRNSETDAESTTQSIFLFVHEMQRFKKLRHEDDFSFGDSDSSNPGSQMNDLITDGSSHGIHLIATIDSYNNINRFMSRKALSEIEMRVLFQMSANDSASLIESPKAANLGLHRALYFNEQEGHLETFRPYALPTPAWLDDVGQKLRTLHDG